MRGKERFIGDKAFYRMILAVAIPIIVQNGITNFVNLLDNIMVGQLGTETISGVSITNQLISVFNICIFGGVSGAGIFTAQYYGKGDQEGIRNTFRFKWMICVGIGILGTLILWLGADPLIHLYLNEAQSAEAVERTWLEGKKYLYIMLVGLLPYAVGQIYVSTLRETGETMLPMKAGITAILVNLILNYFLIYGIGFFPKMGAQGAALATVISRFVELGIVAGWAHTHKKKMPYMEGIYRTLRVPFVLVKEIIKTGMPLMMNEVLWATGFASLTQCYSMRGLDAVAALNISGTISNLFNIFFFSFGTVISIVVGSLLGAGKPKEAKQTDTRIIAFALMVCTVVGVLMALFAPVFPKLYKTSKEVQELACGLIWIIAAFMPVMAFSNCCYFTMRSGGKTVVTFLFDSVFMWVVAFPVAYLLGHHTTLALLPMYFICQMTEFIKCIIGGVLVKKGVWINNMVEKL